MQAQEQSPDSDLEDFDDSVMVASDDSCIASDDDTDVDFSPEIEQIINGSIEENLDYYAHEGLDAFRDHDYRDASTTKSEVSSFSAHNMEILGPSLQDLREQIMLLSKAADVAQSVQHTSILHNSSNDDSSRVFLIDDSEDEPEIMQIVRQFTLNETQEHAFRILAYILSTEETKSANSCE
jgi:hypothetical protein